MRSQASPVNHPWRQPGIVLLALALACTSGDVAATRIESANDSFTVALAETLREPHPELRDATRTSWVLDVTDLRTGAESQMTLANPAVAADDTLVALRVVGDRLVAVGRLSVTVVALPGGTELFSTRAQSPTPSPAGRRIAYAAFHPRWTAPEALTSVVQVLDVPTLSVRSVFPAADRITTDAYGTPFAWVDDASAVEQLVGLFWSPDGERLLLFVRDGVLASGAAEQTTSIVLVDLRDGIDQERTARRPLARGAYVVPDADVEDRRNLFAAASVRWLDDGRVAVTPPEGHWWMPEEVVLELP